MKCRSEQKQHDDMSLKTEENLKEQILWETILRELRLMACTKECEEPETAFVRLMFNVLWMRDSTTTTR